MVTFVIDFLGSSWHPLGWGGVGQICLGSNDSRINPYMRAKFGYSQMILSKKWGVQTDRHAHTQRDTAALYSRQYSFVNSYQPILSTSPLLSTFVNSDLTSFFNNINHLCPYRRGHYFCQQSPTTFVNRNFMILPMCDMLRHTLK